MIAQTKIGRTRRFKRFALSTAVAVFGTAAMASGAQAAHFINPASIFVPSDGAASPSTIPVSGLTGTVSRVTVGLHGLDGEGDSFMALLVGPGGQSTVLTRGACSGVLDFGGISLNFDDAAGSLVPEVNCPNSGIFKPTDRTGSPQFTLRAPPYGTTLSAFNGTVPNGVWTLFAENFDANPSSVDGGWDLDIETITPPVVATPAATLAKKCKKGRKLVKVKGKKRCKKKKKK